MGNCIRSSSRKQHEEDEIEQEQIQDYFGEKNSNNDFNKGSGVKVKIVLTKEELEWLMFKIEGNIEQGKKLEDFLQEIERERVKGKLKAWKPCLESIKESPEMER
ncbi:uncharacterized protein LOC126678042 [Mercurialis annua]|uniref:uncharacterized protein LOC126678042 n=1 Tax=Mercurialis annua TaxID=3986 RepID=UPI00215ECE8D|nr:uncharacterized protein LOC126678042 [Mercurialis annua]